MHHAPCELACEWRNIWVGSWVSSIEVIYELIRCLPFFTVHMKLLDLGAILHRFFCQVDCRFNLRVFQMQGIKQNRVLHYVIGILIPWDKGPWSILMGLVRPPPTTLKRPRTEISPTFFVEYSRGGKGTWGH